MSWISLSKITYIFETDCCKIRTFYSSFLLPKFIYSDIGNIEFEKKEGKNMTDRKRTIPIQFYVNEDEEKILNEKFRLSGMKSKSEFLRQLILYGYVYDVDYSYLRNYNVELGRISSILNQIAARVNSTNRIYEDDMREIKEIMEQVWHTHKSMLSKQPLIKR